MKMHNQSPWLTIPASDYEGHMGSDNVGQLVVLDQLFSKALVDFSPQNLAVLGCATGNGFQHIDPEKTLRIVGIDINKEYLDILSSRYSRKLTNMELVCSDITTCQFNDVSFDLVYSALVFEYVKPGDVLPVITPWIQKGGKLVVVLQMRSLQSKMVSETPYTSLKSLEPIMELVEPKSFEESAEIHGLHLIKSWEVPLQAGKRFHVACYEKS